MTPRLQPMACSSGTISTLGVARMPTAVSKVKNVIAATTHA